jgi:hypothetical protein
VGVDEVKSDMAGNVNRFVAQRDNVLRLPVRAASPRDGRATVTVSKNGKRETGRITGGFGAGDKVVVAGRPTQG